MHLVILLLLNNGKNVHTNCLFDNVESMFCTSYLSWTLSQISPSVNGYKIIDVVFVVIVIRGASVAKLFSTELF